jgi:hypothetical protein
MGESAVPTAMRAKTATNPPLAISKISWLSPVTRQSTLLTCMASAPRRGSALSRLVLCAFDNWNHKSKQRQSRALYNLIQRHPAIDSDLFLHQK